MVNSDETDVVDGKLAGKVALVTGAGQGIGRAIALRLARGGADVAVNDLREDTARNVADEIQALGRQAVTVPADLASVSQIEEMVRRVIDGLGRIDILVNNAGFVRPNPFGSVTEEDWDKTFAVNARGLFFCTQTVARRMIERKRGAIISIASIAGRGFTQSVSPPYAASKAVVISITHQASKALAKHNITVNAVCPGVINTDFNRRLDAQIGQKQQGLPPGEYLLQAAAKIPLGRLGDANDVAEVVAFLASPAGSYVTGQCINVDGGMVVS